MMDDKERYNTPMPTSGSGGSGSSIYSAFADFHSLRTNFENG